MSKPGQILLCLLIALAGCQTPPVEKPATSRPPVASRSQPPRTNAPSPKPASTQTAPRPTKPAAVNQRTNSYAETWVPLSRWVRENRAGTLRQVSSKVAPTYAVVSSNGILFVQANSRVARWDGLELHLGFEPQVINGQPYLHALDLKKNVEPLLRSTATPSKPGRIVVLDPGHGGPATGTTSVVDGEYEKEFTLDWALLTASLLATNGWQVFLTRTDDTDLSLSNRVAFAEEHKADLFISLHFNSAAPSQDQAGVETYCLTPRGMPSTLTRGYDDDVSLVFPNNTFDEENIQYAFRLQRALVHVVGKDRGVRHARFLGVLRGQNRPAVLIEGGYLSNPTEAEHIADPDYREKLAQAVAQALGPAAGFQILAATNKGGGETLANRTNTNSKMPDPSVMPVPADESGATNSDSPERTDSGSTAPRTNSAPLR